MIHEGRLNPPPCDLLNEDCHCGAIDAKPGFSRIIGKSENLVKVLATAAKIAPANTPVLIEGETGTGKELLAQAIHLNSRRGQGPFLAVNCAAIPSELLEAELFGYKRGAFTGAVADRKGKAELANGGTLFLDEIGDLPLAMQAKLLRLVQQNEIEKLGAGHSVTVDVRIIAATNRNLEEMTACGTFREDLYYRLSVVPLRIPSLRERPEDIPRLVHHFFGRLRERHAKPGLRLPAPVAAIFSAGYRWPGNVRELENAVERAVLLANGVEVRTQDLPSTLHSPPTPVEAIRLHFPDGGIALEEVEKELIRLALHASGGNQSQAARLLRISRKALIWRIAKHGLNGS
jgi:two-component system, NtrC family, response regulator AtoC